MLQLTADLNAIWGENWLVASVRRASRPIVVGEHLVGQAVVVADGEGEFCDGIIVGLRDGLVDIRLDLESWRSDDTQVRGLLVSGQMVSVGLREISPIRTSAQSPNVPMEQSSGERQVTSPSGMVELDWALAS
jgi:hypothetical protein